MREIRLLLSGFVIWAVAFLAIYALQATGCAVGMAEGRLRGLLIGTVGLALVAGAVPLWLAVRHRGGAFRLSAILCAVAALASTALTFSAVVWAGLC